MGLILAEFNITYLLFGSIAYGKAAARELMMRRPIVSCRCPVELVEPNPENPMYVIGLRPPSLVDGDPISSPSTASEIINPTQ